MRALRDALAAALHRTGVPRLNDIEDAEVILSDPAFREALVEAVAEALIIETVKPAPWPGGRTTPEFALAIVDRVLTPAPEGGRGSAAGSGAGGTGEAT